MTRARCPRLWQAEAIEDGRLLGAEAQAFRRHKEVCADCAREVAALDRLRRAAERLPAASITPLERRRQRGALLRRANELATGRPRRPAGRAWAVAAALTLVASVAAAAALADRPPEPAPASAPAAAAPAHEVTPAEGTERRRAPEAPAPLEPADRTRDAPEEPAEALDDRAPPPAPSSSPAGERARSRPPASTSPEASRPSRPPSAGAAFTEAMTAFSDGDFARAERLFSAFERAHAGDSRVEDATFLRAVARSRRGDHEGAASLARDYLRRYPGGLRRIEAERLASRPRPSGPSRGP